MFVRLLRPWNWHHVGRILAVTRPVAKVLVRRRIAELLEPQQDVPTAAPREGAATPAAPRRRRTKGEGSR